MIENLAHTVNTLLVQHPNLLHLMHVLFWVKYWILVAIMGIFIYLAYFRDKQEAVPTPARGGRNPKDAFIA